MLYMQFRQDVSIKIPFNFAFNCFIFMPILCQYKLNYLEEVRRIPLMPPNVDAATKSGTIHAMEP